MTDVSGAGGEIDVERLAALAPDVLVGFRGRGPDTISPTSRRCTPSPGPGTSA